ncbi:MAG: hypothetical protein RMJ04_05680 [Geminicoccaceae bacterium]|nr:hypothetical protein [Geminicoccaceae bacterium]
MLATAVLALSLAALRAPAFVQTFAASVAHEAEVAAGREPGRISEGAGGGDAAPASAREADAAPAIEPAAGPVRSPDKLADVAAELAERAKELDRREQELALREAAAAAVEARAREQLARLAQLNKELERLLAAIRAEDEAKLAQLVKTYEAMKAKSAAQVFDQLALDVLIPVARRIREAKLAAIMAAMDPVKAKQLTAALAQPTPLPKPP